MSIGGEKGWCGAGTELKWVSSAEAVEGRWNSIPRSRKSRSPGLHTRQDESETKTKKK